MQVCAGLIALLAFAASAAVADPPALSERVPCYPDRYGTGITAWIDAENGATFFTTLEIGFDMVPPDAPSAALAEFAYNEYAKLRNDVLVTGHLPQSTRDQIRPIDLGLPADSATLAAWIEMDPAFRDIDLRPRLVSLCHGSSSSSITLSNRSQSLEG